MEGFWILIAIIAVIYRVFNKAVNIKEKFPRERRIEGRIDRLPPVFKGLGFPWDEIFTDVAEQESIPAPTTGRAPVREMIPRETTEPKVEPLPTPQPEPRQKRKREAGRERAVSEDVLPLLEPANIINGIILTELLQPPKCRQRRYGRTS